MIRNAKVAELLPEGVLLQDGTMVKGNVPVWATGAEAQGVTAESDLELLKGYFRVNDYL